MVLRRVVRGAGVEGAVGRADRALNGRLPQASENTSPGEHYATSWNASHVAPPPTSTPSASSEEVWRPRTVLAHHTSGTRRTAGNPQAPKTYTRHTAVPETPAAWSERFVRGVRSAKRSVASA